MAGAYVLTKSTHHIPTIIIGKDTRISGDMLEAALVSGICAVGANVVQIGVVPTPAVAYLVRKLKAVAGVMISASHNPMEHNGIKFFDGSGNKLSDSLEEEIEGYILNNMAEIPLETGKGIGRIKRNGKAVDIYIDHVASTINVDVSGIKCLVDCANGSASATAKKLFDMIGVNAQIINYVPSGININDKCGSTYLDELSEMVKNSDCDLGISFDGDADRCLMIDEKGEIIDGDKIIAAIALSLKNEGKLKNNTAVVTVMTNLGFFEMARKNDINVIATSVGDRYVLEEMQKGNYVIGGEQSGHIIMLEHNTTGDGQITALQFLQVMKKLGKSASECCAVMETYPQVMINIHVSKEVKESYLNNEKVKAEIKKTEEILGENGRILVRASGTEDLVRVMIEGKDQKEIEKLANNVGDIIKNL